MPFLDFFPPDQRDRLLSAGRRQAVTEGTLIIRRGESRGDMFLVEEGQFEIVDSRSHPEIVLDVVGPGVVLGELSFVDESPRTADVRATGAGMVLGWSYSEVLALFDAEPAMAASFYRAIATTLTHRFRSLSGAVASGGMWSAGGAGREGVGHARELASKVLSDWVEADDRLRRDPSDRVGLDLVQQGLRTLLLEVPRWLANVPEDRERHQAGLLVARELRPYLSRAVTAELSLDPLAQSAGDPRLMAHIVRGEAAGAGPFGHLLDRLILDLPSMKAIRKRVHLLLQEGRAIIGSIDRTRLLVVNPNCGATLVGLVMTMSRRGGGVCVVDSNRDVLGFVDAGLPRRPPGVSFSFLHADLAAVALGRSELQVESQNIVLVDALVDHLPDRLVVALAGWAQRRLLPGGALMLSALAPTSDHLVVDHILQLPLVRRTPHILGHLVESLGLADVRVREEEGGMVVVGRRPATE